VNGTSRAVYIIALQVRFAIMDLEDLHNNKWIPRGGEKGPKRIEEVREEVEKEQQEMKLERMEVGEDFISVGR
jgi:hypothetical protein